MRLANTHHPNDKRQHKRYLLLHEVIAAINPPGIKVGKIRDISKGGLSFEYIPLNDSHELQEREAIWVGVDIFRHEADFFMLQVPCRVVYDNCVTPPSYPYSRIMMMRCGLQFGELNEEHREKLERLLENGKS